MYNYYHQTNGYWIVNEIRNKKPYCIGSFETEQEASNFVNELIGE